MYDTQAELEAFLKHFYQVRFVRRLGEGAFGLAILVYDGIEQIHKVFKLPRDRKTTEALIHEGMNLRKLRDLSHPNIIQLYQFGAVPMEWQGTTEERYYINMAFGGTSLRAKLGRLRYDLDAAGAQSYTGSGTRLPLDDVLRIGIDVCRGLEAAHGFRGAQVRILHRDISPDNILIDDESGVARLADFGIARVLDRSSQQASFAGKLIYMDPLCFQGRASFHSDLYSLAIVLYEASTGALPFATFAERTGGPPKAPHEHHSDLPPEFSAIVLRALANDAAARYDTSSALLADLSALRSRLNPLPARYARVAAMDDGRLLCEDREAGGPVAVRVVSSPVAPAELRTVRDRLEALKRPALEPYARDFRNEQFIGIVSQVPPEPSLADLCGRCAKPENCSLICDLMATVCDLLEAAHRAGVCHGFLSPHAVTLPAGEPRLHELGLGPLFRADSPDLADGILGALKPLHPYLSPRLLAGGAGATVPDDVYSLGALTYFAFTGVAPSGGAPRSTDGAAEAPPDGAMLHRAPGAARFNLAERLRMEDLLPRAPEAPPRKPLRDLNPVVPPRLDALVNRCLARAPQDRPASAAEVAAGLRAINWPDEAVEALADDALRLFQPGGSDDALIEACDRIQMALHLDPGNPRAHFARGVVYVRHGSYEFAVEEFVKSARVSPGFEVYAELGRAYDRLKRPGPTADAFRKALEYGEAADVRRRLEELAPGTAPPPRTAACPVCGAVVPGTESHPCSRCAPVTVAAPVPAFVGCATCGGVLPSGADDPTGLCPACRAAHDAMHTQVAARDGPPALRDYEFVREIGRGGMGVVYLARHRPTDTLVALKVMLPAVALGESARAYFLREVANTRALDHPNTVRLLHADCSEGMFFFTTEYCAGGCLSKLVHDNGPLSVERATHLILQALDGLEYAHRVAVPHAARPDGSSGPGRGLVHRDIKPSNLFLTGDGAVVKVGDFGLSKAFGTAGMSGQTVTSTIRGTPKYMPRQQAEDFKYAEPAVDVWAMAATYYYLLTGHPPRDFPTGRSWLSVVLTTDAVPIRTRNPAIPDRLAEVIDLALADRPELAVKTAADLADRIRRAVL